MENIGRKQSILLKSLKAQLALGTLTRRDFWIAWYYPNRPAPGEKYEILAATQPNMVRYRVPPRKFVINSCMPDDALHWIRLQADNFASQKYSCKNTKAPKNK